MNGKPCKLLLGLCLLLPAWVGSFGGLPPIMASDVDLVIGTNPPFRLQMSLMAGERTWSEHFQTLQDTYHNLLFDRLDANRDGRLSEPEAQRAPAPDFRLEDLRAAQAKEMHIAFNFLVLDEDGDGAISREELKSYYADYGAGVWSLGPLNGEKSQVQQAMPLLHRLDRNRDFVLESAEVQAAGDLWRLDRDADEALSASELEPQTIVSDKGEFIALDPGYPVRPVENFTVQMEPVSDKAPAADIQLSYQMSRGRFAPFKLQPGKSSKGIEATRECVVLSHKGLRFEIRVQPESLRLLEQTRNVLHREFAALPGEKRITEELSFPPFLRDHAALIDANADAHLTADELESYLTDLLPARLAAKSGRVMLRTSPAVTGLFAYLDQNHDGQLSRRELSGLEDVMNELDENRDGKLSLAEMPSLLRVVLVRESAAPPYLPSDEQTAGPPWFYRLDRNKDGTLSRIEFPGDDDLFQRLDDDRDHVLSLEEALAAEKNFHTTSRDQED